MYVGRSWNLCSTFSAGYRARGRYCWIGQSPFLPTSITGWTDTIWRFHTLRRVLRCWRWNCRDVDRPGSVRHERAALTEQHICRQRPADPHLSHCSFLIVQWTHHFLPAHDTIDTIVKVFLSEADSILYECSTSDSFARTRESPIGPVWLCISCPFPTRETITPLLFAQKSIGCQRPTSVCPSSFSTTPAMRSSTSRRRL